MSKPEFYQAPPGWHFLAALLGAVAIEAAAVAAAGLIQDKTIQTKTGVFQNQVLEGVVTVEPPESTPTPLEDLPPPLPLPPDEITDFALTEPSPPPRTAINLRPTVKATVSRAAHATAGPVNFVSGQSQMIFSPPPGYPFEARRAKQTGSGKFLLRFDANGNVAEVETVRSTGSVSLDQVSWRTLRQWRCQPGAYENIYVPITFTLQGAQL